MKTIRLSLISSLFAAGTAMASTSAPDNDTALKFDPANYSTEELTMPDGTTVRYRAYEHIYYVSDIEDPEYQYLNFYVPESLDGNGDNVPILLRTYIGGYMAARAAKPSATDATGRALAEGYAVCIPGSRGSNSTVERDGKTIYTGRIPAGLLDLKAAVRYLRYNDDTMPGSAELIITDGTSAGGAMSALLGSTGNAAVYAPYLREMGAADTRDDVFAAVCYCPITDLDHADMAYEWLYGSTDKGVRDLSPDQIRVSEELAAEYPAYINSLMLKAPDGTLLTDTNFRDYIGSFIIASAQRARNEGCEIPEGIGITMNEKSGPRPRMHDNAAGRPASGSRPPMKDAHQPSPDNRPAMSDNERRAPSFGPQGMTFHKEQGEFVVAFDMDSYLNYVASVQPLKTPPAFDAMNVLVATPTPENNVFGDSSGNASNFTEYSLRKATRNPSAELSAEMKRRVYMMNPMNFIGTTESSIAHNWYIRHGARDRDTSFCIPVALATKLANAGYSVDFALPWNRPHSGDYNLDDLFDWIKSIVK